MQIIHLGVNNAPIWAQISFTENQILVSIPQGEEVVRESTSLIIFISDDAPANTYLISLKASVNPIGRINGNSYQESISFTPEYSPFIEVTGINSVVTPPGQSVSFPIYVKNIGNKISTVDISITNLEDLEDWTPTVNPQLITLDINKIGVFWIGVIAPIDFSGIATMYLHFSIEAYPPGASENIGNFQYYIQFHYP
jgi:hypothetical protein